jgi:hypothetical protein
MLKTKEEDRGEGEKMMNGAVIQSGLQVDQRPKWFNSPVTVHSGTLSEVRPYVREFERRGFGLTQPSNDYSRLNERLDTIVRLPFGNDPSFIPIGVVSKDYALVQHTTVIDVVTQALTVTKIPPDNIKAELKITEYGERMALMLYLPEKYQFDPGDGHLMALRLECLNSVDGSTRFRALMGWFRFICSNGLVIGVTLTDMRRRHDSTLSIEDVKYVLTSGIESAEKDRESFLKWLKTPITPRKLASWIDKELKVKWGFKAATRAYHIARSGKDAEIIGPYKNHTPTTIPVRQSTRVPGAQNQCDNLYNLSQILAWLAKERRDIQEQLAWREEIPHLINTLN